MKSLCQQSINKNYRWINYVRGGQVKKKQVGGGGGKCQLGFLKKFYFTGPKIKSTLRELHLNMYYSVTYRFQTDKLVLQKKKKLQQSNGPLVDCETLGVFSHSARTAPIIMLFILRTPLKTTHLQKHA